MMVLWMSEKGSFCVSKSQQSEEELNDCSLYVQWTNEPLRFYVDWGMFSDYKSDVWTSVLQAKEFSLSLLYLLSYRWETSERMREKVNALSISDKANKCIWITWEAIKFYIFGKFLFICVIVCKQIELCLWVWSQSMTWWNFVWNFYCFYFN